MHGWHNPGPVLRPVHMEIDPNEVRRLRESRAWSQEHLAGVAGLSVRTVQRVERGDGASLETRMALASAFDVAPVALCVASPGEVEAPLSMHDGTAPPTARPRAGMSARSYRAAMVLTTVLIVFALFLLFGYLLGRDLAHKERRQACVEQGRSDCSI